MDKKAIMMILVFLAVFLCLVSLGVSLWYYFTPSEDDDEEESTEEESTEEESTEEESTEEESTEEESTEEESTEEESTPPASSSTPPASSSTPPASSSTPPASSSTPATLSCEAGQLESNGECIPIKDMYVSHANKTWWHIKDISYNDEPDMDNSLMECFDTDECIGVIRNKNGRNFVVKKGDQPELIKKENGFKLYVKRD